MLKTAYRILPCSAVSEVIPSWNDLHMPHTGTAVYDKRGGSPTFRVEPTGYMRLPAYKEKLAVSVPCEVIAWHIHMLRDYSRLGIYPCQAYMPILYAFARCLRSPTITL